MRISEKMGVVYTALFLTVSVAVITQNSDSLMAAFRGESNVKAVDDIFTVRAGRDQRLFVLRNDVNAQGVTASAISLGGQPKCGVITQTGGSFVYSNSAACSGNQTFSYCLNTGRTCLSANVALRLVEARDPIDSVATGPVTDLSGFDEQVDMNAHELEITNVHLGRVAAVETTQVSTSGAKLAKVAIETPITFHRPEPIAKVGKVDGTFDMETPDSFVGETRSVADISADTVTQTDALEVAETPDFRLPSDPDSLGVANLPTNANSGLTARMVRIDMGFKAPKVMPGIDNSPFGTACSTDLQLTAAPGGLIELEVSAPCLPNTRVEVRHGKMTVAFRIGHSGTLSEVIPAFEEKARFAVVLADGTLLKSSVKVPDLKNVDRIAIQWKGAYDIGLHALEFGADPGSGGHVSAAQTASNAPSVIAARGYAIRLGDATVDNPVQVEIYSLIHSGKTASGVVELIVSAAATPEVCGKSQILHSFRSRGGRLVGASGLRFKMPECDSSNQSIVLKNAVRDLIIASK